MWFQRFFVEGLAHSSYVLGSETAGQAIVIDPRRDIDVYVEAARQRGARVTHVIETHIHADFVSGARELVDACGATCICGPGANLGFAHRPAVDGERLDIGEIALTVLHTPGHTPEHICILADAPGEPPRVFTGDTLFVGAVGRPDLLGEGWTTRLATDLCRSLFDKLLRLDGGVEVHPAHGAGSLCGRGIGSQPSSTIGFERETNPLLKHSTERAFVDAVLGDLPETPPYFPRMKRINHDGPPLLGLSGPVEPPPALDPERAADEVRRGAMVIDARDGQAYADGHPLGAINIGYGSRLGYWAGWVLPESARIVLLVGDEETLAEARRQLLRVGFDDLIGHIAGGLERWRAAGLPISSLPQLTVDELQRRLTDLPAMRLLDVRTAIEWRDGHLDRATHMPVGEVPVRLCELDPETPIATICESGYRSSLAASLLAHAGFRRVASVPGGMVAIRRASQPHA
ncbi:MAG: MBL fold metallo-hydrolase [Acidobacteria bacterium]|nr:MBL fold metallo-hydrolase [Acidobacteriota bacterium]